MKKIVLLNVVTTIIWYVIIRQVYGQSGVCMCPQPVDGISFPRLIPMGCGDCGIGINFFEFLSELFLILFPAIMITIIYFLIKRWKGISQKER
jgi:hypothetical protein